ncbi:sulfotransferase domain-containing protein [Nodularia spumigena]|uniref:sulfotransferase domain-containing protein n=1 Tax=Nodularia spumigena TaxID=70799 RepID=UPI00232C3D04|nr:sulfotransferase domain-containing protein [Nodularia spumigena]MDB9317676.1 sulfotransferase domain-containing protein [Nodularia spumigena CS-590/01A]MDB9326830.1 sulfotransferase domain-containing protein [Nodularia spumigena CS-590/02]MDB9337056.1 sulfotransferase domain-containing protein [Nodularia spumigena CS-590/01]
MSNQYLDYAKGVREEIFQQIQQPLWQQKSLKDVSKVILILSSPRSGSSLLFHLLSQTEQLLSLNGEHTNYYKLNGYSFPFHNYQSDFLGITNISREDFDKFSRDFLSDVCVGSEKIISTTEELQEFIQILALRLPTQWPQLSLSAQQWLWYITEACKQHMEEYSTWDFTKFLLKLLELLSIFYPEFNPFYYDIQPSLLKSYFPENSCPKSPPNSHFCIEEPPFVVTKPRRRPTPEEISNKPWLLKASIDAFRLPLLQQLFPNAEFKIIHLTRFPATSINGLYDGWHHRGFFSHNLEGIANLAIPGYSDVFDWGKHWWSYELPPQWQEVINQPLEYVCGFQWSSPHQVILESLKQEKASNILRVQFEDIISSSQQRVRTIGRILEFMGIEEDDALKKVVDEMQPVMCSVPADETRWLKRKSQILQVINEESIRQLINELGYGNREIA